MATDRLSPLLLAALECAEQALTVPVERAALYPGAEVAWDDACGQLWARLVLLEAIGDQGRQNTPCGPILWRVTIAVGIIRCVAGPDDNGEPPAPATLTADTVQMTQDMADIAKGLTCCLAERLEPEALGEKLNLVQWSPLGPQGMSGGGEWQATVLVGVGG